MNLEDKAREYAEGKSSASVFRDAHIRDFKAGYEEGLKDNQLLKILKEVRKTVDWGYSSWGNDQGFILSEKIDNLIREYENNN